MDVLAALYATRRRREAFQLPPGLNALPNMSNMYSIMLTLLAAYAAYISWTCNGGAPALLRVVYAAVAWIFGGIYVGWHVLFRGGSCR